jgi:primosomal protein N' (replication factor Y)
MDRDTTARKGALLKILKELRKGDIDILIGTQMVAKGHHYPNITLVGILCADLSLNFPDFRAGERTFQLLAQVAGRAGRGKQPGRVILQSYNPTHFCITAAANQTYEDFYKQEIAFRKALHYPPYTRLVQILITGKDKIKTAQCAKSMGAICGRLQRQNHVFSRQIQTLGPVPAPVARIQNRYRWLILLKGSHAGSLHQFAKLTQAEAKPTSRSTETTIAINVDPVDML